MTLRFDAVEARWVEVREAYVRFDVVRSSGGAVDGIPEDAATLEGRYRSVVDGFEAMLEALDPSRLDSSETVGLAGIRDTLNLMVEEDGLSAVDPDGGDEDDGADEDAVGDDADDVEALRRRILGAYGRAAAAIPHDGGTIDRLTALTGLATMHDPAARRRLFEAMASLYRAVDGDGGPGSPYRRLVRERAARWRTDGSPIDATARRLGIDPSAVEGWLHQVLAAWRDATGDSGLEPWDYRFAVGAADRRLTPRITAPAMLAANRDHLVALGADPDALGIVYDIVPRPGRPLIPVAYTTFAAMGRLVEGAWRPTRPWVFATYDEPSLGNLQELLHESGHAIHYAAIRARPATFDGLEADSAFFEGIADVVGWDASEPAWQARHLGDAAPVGDALRDRCGAVMLDLCWTLFEIEVHRDPELVPNDVWTGLTERYLGIVSHPELSWWAIRGQLIELPGYMSNYAYGAMIAADVRARIREIRGDWLDGDPGWYEFVSDRLLRFGGERASGDVLAEFLGRPLSPDALIADVRRLAGT